MSYDDLPSFVIDQLSELPEDKPADFVCAICQSEASNQWVWSPREYHLPPFCKSCENIKGYSHSGRSMQRTKPTGGTFRDRRHAVRIVAIADAIAQEVQQQLWRTRHGRA